MSYIKEYTSLHPKEQRQLTYKRQYKNDVPTWDDSMVLLTKLVKERMHQPTDVLDFGCGHGNFVIDELKNIFEKKIGYDVSAEATSKNTSVNEVVIGDGKNLPFDPNTFDLTISLWAFEHVEDPLHLFKEIHRVLRPGGYFAFVTPNKRSLLIRLRQLMNKRIADQLLDLLYGRKDDDVFDVFYRANSLEDIEHLAKQAGLKIDCLIENPDPSYTSFDSLSYFFSKWFSALPLSMSKPHIVAILKKSN